MKDIDSVIDALTELQEHVGSVNREHGFRDYTDSVRHDPEALVRVQANALLLIVGEAIEAHEELRAGRPSHQTYYSGGFDMGTTESEQRKRVDRAGRLRKPEGVPSEIADIVIRCLDFADAHGFNLGEIIAEKLAYNETRPFKHGKRF